jgi:hypothetical protein
MTVVQQDIQQSTSARDLLNAQNVAPTRPTYQSSTSVPVEGRSAPLPGNPRGLPAGTSVNSGQTPWSAVQRVNTNDPEQSSTRDWASFTSMDANYLSMQDPEQRKIINQAFVDAGLKYEIDPAILKAIAMKESSLDPRSVNKESNATGLGNILPSTADMLAGRKLTQEELMDPKLNAELMAKYLTQIQSGLEKDGKPALIKDVAARYFQGPSATPETLA